MIVFHGMDWPLHHILKIIMMILGGLFCFLDEESRCPRGYNLLKVLQLVSATSEQVQVQGMPKPLLWIATYGFKKEKEKKEEEEHDRDSLIITRYWRDQVPAFQKL